MTARPAAIFRQRQRKRRRAQPAEFIIRARSSGDLPARGCRAWFAPRILAQQQRQAFSLLRRQGQTPRSGQIGRFTALCQFADDRGNAPRLERLFHRPKRVLRRCRANQKETFSIDAERRAAQPIKRGGFQRGEVLLDEDNGALLRRRQSRQGERKTQGRSMVRRAGRRQLMQFRKRQPSLQHAIGDS